MGKYRKKSDLVFQSDLLYNATIMKEYIVFDLEWNQSPYGKDTSVGAMPFEVIEIGAVKLNEQMEKVSDFRCLIRPQVYRELTGSFLYLGFHGSDRASEKYGFLWNGISFFISSSVLRYPEVICLVPRAGKGKGFFGYSSKGTGDTGRQAVSPGI